MKRPYYQVMMKDSDRAEIDAGRKLLAEGGRILTGAAYLREAARMYRKCLQKKRPNA